MEGFNQLFEVPFLGGILFTIIGIIQIFFPPKSSKSIYGYRTSTSMQSQENWDFAQKYSGRKLLITGIFLLAVGFFLDLSALSDTTKRLVELGLLLGAVFFVLVTTEAALKKRSLK